MRVSIDCRYVRERPSGIGSYVQGLLEHLPRLAPDVHFQLWADPRAPRPLSHAPNVEARTVSAVANGLRTLLVPSRLMDLSQVDVLHAPFNTLGRGIACPTVVTIHDLMWLERPHLCGRSPLWPVQYLYYRDGILRALARATRIVAISHATADAVRGHIADPRRIRVIPHGVHPRFTPLVDSNAETTRRSLARLGVRRPFFLAVGQNAPFKNHRAVRSAFAAASLPTDVELVIVERLHQQNVGRDHRVRVLASVRDDELVALYRATLGLVQFSRWEGFGMPALEAAACGAPILASDIPALRENLDGAALLLPLRIDALRAALEAVARDAVLREELGQRSRERGRRFRWEDSARLHLELYRDAASGPALGDRSAASRGRRSPRREAPSQRDETTRVQPA